MDVNGIESTSGVRFCAPPGWEWPHAGQLPRPLWSPNPSWPSAPTDWAFYRDATDTPIAPPSDAWLPPNKHTQQPSIRPDFAILKEIDDQIDEWTPAAFLTEKPDTPTTNPDFIPTEPPNTPDEPDVEAPPVVLPLLEPDATITAHQSVERSTAESDIELNLESDELTGPNPQEPPSNIISRLGDFCFALLFGLLGLLSIFASFYGPLMLSADDPDRIFLVLLVFGALGILLIFLSVRRFQKAIKGPDPKSRRSTATWWY
jgi:hypothetical protein